MKEEERRDSLSMARKRLGVPRVRDLRADWPGTELAAMKHKLLTGKDGGSRLPSDQSGDETSSDHEGVWPLPNDAPGVWKDHRVVQDSPWVAPRFKDAAGPGLPRTSRIRAATAQEYNLQSRRCVRQPVYPSNEAPPPAGQERVLRVLQEQRSAPPEFLRGAYHVEPDGVEVCVLTDHTAMGMFEM